MSRTQDKESVKRYMDLLDQLGWEDKKTMAAIAFGNIDRAGRYLGMVLGEPEDILDETGNLKDGRGKGYAIHALTAAKEKLHGAWEGFSRVDFLVGKGARDSVVGFKNGVDSALDRPFPVIAVEKELKSIMDCLAGAFAALDIGIGRIEESEGMTCERGHYLDSMSGALWEGGTGEQAWLDILWPMRSLEKMIISVQDAVHQTTCFIDSMRPKASSIIKKHVLSPGLDWKIEKERERIAQLMAGQKQQHPDLYLWNGGDAKTDNLFVAEDTGMPGARNIPVPEKGSRKTSLRKRLKTAGEKSRKTYARMEAKERKNRTGELYR